jgi:hypothetical protein
VIKYKINEVFILLTWILSEILTLKLNQMKKTSLILIVLLFLAWSAQSQVKFGVRAGLTSSSISASDLTVPGAYKIETLSNATVGFQFGLLSRIQISSFFIQPELLLSTSGGSVKVYDLAVSNDPGVIKDQKFTKLDIPVLLGTKMGPIRLGIGPVASMVLNSKSELTDYHNFGNKFKTATFGYQVGLGLDIWKLAIDLKYEGNLSQLGDNVTIGGASYKFDSRAHQFILGVGLFF